VRIAYFGTPDIAVPTLDALVQAGHDLALVVSRPDQPAGRHLHVATPAVVEAARRLGLPTAQPERLGTDEFIGRLRALAVDVAVVVAYGKLISPRVLRVPPRGFVNLHPSLLPRHRGPAPIVWAIAEGDETTGVTTMQLDEGMDTGPILLQRATPIGGKERAPELEARLARIGADVMVETLAAIAAGTVRPTPQDHAAATVTPKLERRHGRIDWSWTAARIARCARAFDPWPGLYSTFRGVRVKVHCAEDAGAAEGPEDPGRVLAVSPAGIAVRCGEGGAVLLTELQREGKRRLPADAFIIGERVARGETFG
jgi:methionyl-tRNA formyltransferase